MCGVGLVIGYALLGASWLVLKTTGPLQHWAYARVGWLLLGVLVFLAAAFVFALVADLGHEPLVGEPVADRVSRHRGGGDHRTVRWLAEGGVRIICRSS